MHLPNQQLVLFNAHSNPSEILSTAMHIKLMRFFKEPGTVEKEVKTNVTYPTFKQAAQQLGLLESDNEWFNCLSEASLFQMPLQLRLLFATILVYCQPAGVRDLWDAYLLVLTEDFVYAAQQLGQNATPEDPLIISRALLEIEDHIRQCGKSLEDFSELPAIHYDLLNCNRQTQLFIEETTFLQDKLQQILEGRLQELINYIYSNLQTRWNNHQYLLEHAILTTKNQGVAKINNLILSDFSGEEKTYCSADSVGDAESINNNLYPPEFLNTLFPNSMPPHKLNLKKSVPIILLRNLNAKKDLCNGTCLIIRDFQQHVLDAEVVTGLCPGLRVFIPHIVLEPSDTELPFKLRRRQFSIKLAFALTINKAQGQTIPNLRLYLPEPVFTHGQLYVALSR
ncbi:2367_t:CDS:2, partial [Dentiscutata heterogama]